MESYFCLVRGQPRPPASRYKYSYLPKLVRLVGVGSAVASTTGLAVLFVGLKTFVFVRERMRKSKRKRA